MTDDKPRVLIVDDSRGDIRIVNESLKELYTTLAATNGEKALELAVKDPKPEVILMDVEMPGMNGYETCQKIKANPETADIDVIFVSAHDTADEIVAGYDAGGTDYLTKPIEPKELLKKIKIAIEHRRQRLDITSAKSDVEKIALTAMTSAGEQGVVFNFLRECHKANSLEQLASMIVSAVDQYNLKNAVQIRSTTGVIDKATDNCIIPLEQELLSRLKDHSPLIEKGHRAIFNYGEISLLIKSIDSDAEKWGRIRDNLSILLQDAHAKYQAINMKDQVSAVITSAHEALEHMTEYQKIHKEESQKIVDRMLVNLEESYSSLHLTGPQEEVLSGHIQAGVNESIAHHEKGSEFELDLKKIIASLTKIGQT